MPQVFLNGTTRGFRGVDCKRQFAPGANGYKCSNHGEERDYSDDGGGQRKWDTDGLSRDVM